MDYPKYVEFKDGEIVVFEGIKHAELAEVVGKEAVSAGHVVFPTKTRGSYMFVSNSVSLGLKANPKLQDRDFAWFGGLMAQDDKLLLSTNKTTASKLCWHQQHAPLPMVQLEDAYGNVSHLPLVPDTEDEKLARFSGYLACDFLDGPVKRIED
jgi:hypothetical protein